jgi:hypothetical protein
VIEVMTSKLSMIAVVLKDVYYIQRRIPNKALLIIHGDDNELPKSYIIMIASGNVIQFFQLTVSDPRLSSAVYVLKSKK